MGQLRQCVIFLVVWAVACGRVGYDSSPADASSQLVDAHEDLDAARSFVVVDTIVVPSDGVVVSSSAVLSSSGVYRLRASGTMVVGGVGDQMGDAEYHDFSNPTDDNSLNGQDYGVSINSATVGQKANHWGPFNPTNIYESDISGQDQTISINLHDGVYTNNVGSLLVEILESR